MVQLVAFCRSLAAAIPRIVASVNDTISELKDEIEILGHLRKHLEMTVRSGETN